MRLPERLKTMEDDEEFIKIKAGKSTYYNRLKRKSVSVDESMENECLENSEQYQPPTKRRKFNDTSEDLQNVFQSYVAGIFDDVEMYRPRFDSGSERFLLSCNSCGKHISVGYKMRKNGLPTFTKTNIKSHKCFSVTKSNENLAEDDDSGIM